MVFTNYPNKGIVFLLGITYNMYTLNPFTINNNTPPSFNKYVTEPKGFMIYPKKKKIAHALSNFGHKQLIPF
jgi:hypothetical protein